MKQDPYWMNLAILEGEKGRVDAPPNPWVGCVIVKNGQLVGKGFHPECGQPHAEIFALREAGENAKGASVYVTLEPCSHYGRTPPCVKALIEAKVGRVCIGLKDPDSSVAGSGIVSLERSGIPVTVGICHQQVSYSLQPYLHHRKTGKPFVIAKAAATIDGRIAAEDGSSQWISCDTARADAHLLRAHSQAILVGSGTAIEDSPRLTVRHPLIKPKKNPLRVLLDRSGKTPPTSPLFDISQASTLVFSENKRFPNNIEVIHETNVDDILSILGKRGVIQLLIEGGTSVLTSFLKRDLINQFVLYTGAKCLGATGKPLFHDLGIHSIENAKDFIPSDVKLIGTTVKTIYERSYLS